MCKDCGLLCRRLKANDLDIIFKKAKQDPIKRKITLEEFVYRAVPLLAITSKRAMKDLARDVVNGRPSSTGSVPNTSSDIFSKLTNPSEFTGEFSFALHSPLYMINAPSYKPCGVISDRHY